MAAYNGLLNCLRKLALASPDQGDKESQKVQRAAVSVIERLSWSKWKCALCC